MEGELAEKIEIFRKLVTKEGEEVVFIKFPSKILELHQLLQTTLTADSPFHTSHADTFTDTTVYPPISLINGPASKKRKRDNESQDDQTTSIRDDGQHAPTQGRILANHHMSHNVHDVVKSECSQFAAMIDQVKLWVTLTMPKIEDGDNFGVQIQEEALAELHRAQESAYNLRDTPRQDYLARAKICSKILKYPNVEDYTLALKEHDERQLYIARQHLLDIRNMYAVLTDLIQKNISKIRAPKANNSIGLY